MASDPQRPRTVTEIAQLALATAEKTRADFEAFRAESRRDSHFLHETMGKMMKVVIHADETAVDMKAIAERIERRMLGTEPRAPTPSQHDLDEVAKRAARETVEEIKTDRHIIPPMSMPSERVRETIKNERNELVVGVLAKVAVALVVAFALLGAGMAIRDCQHGTVPTQLH